jgi:hypothetical protein
MAVWLKLVPLFVCMAFLLVAVTGALARPSANLHLRAAQLVAQPRN